MRELTQHHTNDTNEALRIAALDAPGAGGAHHLYLISGFDASTNPSREAVRANDLAILFQHGPVADVGVNGVTAEALLAILIDRFRALHAGPYEVKSDNVVLDCLEQALTHLHSRTLERQARGVEGTHGL